ncbi:anti-sigma factor family protein [Roseimaritima ulvae]|uniref:Zinc-finger domain-containing protein n=1 Tax=Roseimaritima ulvae TaxID=980254 RepID=A0A5B9QU00_9BACT|nr:hypothetical protein [Roseimaritima ulvae]QEG42537.1 hypothetical protein UC8_45770 [Roseimaritima ulvae]
MPLPPEQSDQLLNEYLDDALGAERLSMVEKALAADPAVALRLEQLREERTERLQAFREDPRFRNVRLSPDFTQRVVAAAAAASALPSRSGTTSQPAAAMAQPAAAMAQPAAAMAQPAAAMAQPAAAMSRLPRWVRPVAVVAGIAAAVLIAVSLFPGQSVLPDPGQNSDRIAQASGPPLDDKPTALPLDPEQAVAGVDTPDTSMEDVRIAAAPRATSDADSMTPTDPETVSPEIVAPEIVTPETVSPSAIAQAMDPAANGGSPDLVPSPDSVPAGDPATNGAPANSIPLNMVLIYEVTQTTRGKANGAVLASLRKAGIEVQAHRAVSDEVVGYLQQAKLVGADVAAEQNADTPRVSILYIEASGKALDRFMVSMFTDTENVAQLRWNVAADPPMAVAVKRLQEVSETDVRHAEDNSVAWQLVSGEGEQVDFAVNADGRPLLPLQRQGWDGISSGDQGADIQSRLILLLR